jgi:hypothetical protein
LDTTSIREAGARVHFANRLFADYPSFKPTRALYLDFEGSFQSERILSLYWPQLAGDSRFRILWRGLEDTGRGMNPEGLAGVLEELECEPGAVEWVVVFSAGMDRPEERDRFEVVFGAEVLAGAQWVNLHTVLRRCWQMKRAITQRAYVRFTKDAKQVRKSLEALEFEFGLRRPPGLRRHTNTYADGSEGLMNILEFEQALFDEDATEEQVETLLSYCEWDVRSMFKIARQCGKLLDR